MTDELEAKDVVGSDEVVDKEESKPQKKKKSLLAQKDFRITQNSDDWTIKAGDDIIEKGIPERFWDNLKTEGVIN